MIEARGDLIENRVNSAHQDILPRSIVTGGADVPIPKGLGKNELDLWWDLSHDIPEIRPSDSFILWSGKASEAELEIFSTMLESSTPGSVAWTSHDFIKYWHDPMDRYLAKQLELFPNGLPDMPWMADSILSMKIGEVMSKFEAPVHVLYSRPDGNNMPEGTMLSSLEMPIVTDPGSRVTEMFRWEVGQLASSTFHPERIWQKSDPQMGSITRDLRNDPKDKKGKQKADPDSSDEPPSNQPSPNLPDFDFDNVPTLDQARENMAQTLSNTVGKAQSGEITQQDVQNMFSVSEDLYLTALKSIVENGRLTSEVENMISEYSSLNRQNSLVSDPVGDRFQWRLPKKDGKFDATMDNDLILRGKPDGEGNLVNNGNKIPIKSLETSTPDASLIAKAQLATFGIAKHLMLPEYFETQTPAMQQIMNMAADPRVFSKLEILGKATTGPIIEPETDQALALSRLIYKGVQNTDWWKNTPEEIEEVLRHTYLAITQGIEKYGDLISQPNLPLGQDLVKQTNAISKAMSDVASNLPASEIPQIPLEELSNMPVKDILTKTLTTKGIIGGSVGAASCIVFGIIGGLWGGGIFSRKKKRFDPKTQDLVQCEGDCKPVSEHKFEQKAVSKPDVVKTSTITSSKPTTLLKSVTKTEEATKTASNPKHASSATKSTSMTSTPKTTPATLSASTTAKSAAKPSIVSVKFTWSVSKAKSTLSTTSRRSSSLASSATKGPETTSIPYQIDVKPALPRPTLSPISTLR